MTARTKQPARPHSTQAYLDIAAIKHGIVILKSGGMRAVIQVTSLNFALKSTQEQEDTVLRYQGFLNALQFPIQIVMQSRQIDLGSYLEKLKARAEEEESERIRNQIVAYGTFMERLIGVANIMDKRFYVVVPFDPVGLKERGFFDRLLHPQKQVTVTMSEAEFDQFTAQLDQRVTLVTSGLGSLGLQAARLTTQQLIELYYRTYNPEEASRERLTNVEALRTNYVGDETLPADGATPTPHQPAGEGGGV